MPKKKRWLIAMKNLKNYKEKTNSTSATKTSSSQVSKPGLPLAAQGSSHDGGQLQSLADQISGLIAQCKFQLCVVKDETERSSLEDLDNRNEQLSALLEEHTTANEELCERLQKMELQNAGLEASLLIKFKKELWAVKEQLQAHVHLLNSVCVELQASLDNTRNVLQQKIDKVDHFAGQLASSQQSLMDLAKTYEDYFSSLRLTWEPLPIANQHITKAEHDQDASYIVAKDTSENEPEKTNSCDAGDVSETKGVFTDDMEQAVESVSVGGLAKAHEQGLFSCSMCLRTFEHRSDLNTHKRTHTEENSHICDVCGKILKTRGTLLQHKKLHFVGKPYSCDQCGKRFKQKLGLTSHLKVHSGEKPYCCSVCGKGFPSSGALRRHERRHKGEIERRHLCDICGYKCFTPCELRKHMIAHSEVRLFACSECGNGYKTKGALIQHIKIVHEKVKNYCCDICGSKFYSPNHLKRHVLMHTGDKPYVCEICGKACTQKSNLTIHMRVHNKNSI